MYYQTCIEKHEHLLSLVPAPETCSLEYLSHSEFLRYVITAVAHLQSTCDSFAIVSHFIWYCENCNFLIIVQILTLNLYLSMDFQLPDPCCGGSLQKATKIVAIVDLVSSTISHLYSRCFVYYVSLTLPQLISYSNLSSQSVLINIIGTCSVSLHLCEIIH